MPAARGPTARRSDRRAAWPAIGAVLAVTCVVAAVAWLSGATHDSSSATPVPVVTAPVSTAPTPAPGATASVIGPPLRVVTQPDACSGADAPVLRVLQFNIRAARTGSGGVDLPRIAAEISAVRPDLVSLNEVDTDTTRTHADEPAYLARATGLHVVYGPNVIYDGGPFGNAVLTRYPVVESHNLRLPGAPGLEPRGLLTVVVDVDGHHVAFSSTHLSDGDTGRRSRLLQALAVARALRSTPGPTILAGDLNSDPGDVPARILRQGLLDAQRESGTVPGGTYPQDDPVGRFDYILYDRDLATVPGSTRVRTSESSDHRAVLTRLVLPTRRGC